MKEIIFLYGLPGSGKTHYAKSFNSGSAKVIDLDYICKIKKKKEDILSLLKSEVEDSLLHWKYSTIIIDGLITTNKRLLEIIDFLNENLHPHRAKFKYSIVFFEEDREQCLINDLGRRSIQSKISIQNMPFEEIDSSVLNKVKCVKRVPVYKKPPERIWAAKLGLDDETMILESASWCLGGNSRDYLGGCYDVSADVQPVGFVEFDDLLLKICPNISFLQYRKIFNSCCATGNRGHNDYYGGSVSYGYYICDLNLLYEELKELNLIEG
jgi:predicted kinase